MKQLVFFLSVALLFSSCVATHLGTINSSALGKPVSYVDRAYGVAQTQKYFALGGLSQDALVLEAKRELYRNRPLNSHEEYVNFTVDFKNTWVFFPVYTQTKVTLSADVINFNPANPARVFTDEYAKKLSSPFPANPLFSVNDSVLTRSGKEGVLLAFTNETKVRVLFLTKNDKLRTKKLAVNKLFTRSKSYKGFTVGDSYFFSKEYKGIEEAANARIIGIGLNHLLVKEPNGNVSKVVYK
ncbi:MAG: DUF6567 family protein [Salinivirgaceae bacterium]